MTVTIGSRWTYKARPVITATVISTMKYHGTKYIIYGVTGRWDSKPVLKIMPHWQFVKLYRHPDTVGDVP